MKGITGGLRLLLITLAVLALTFGLVIRFAYSAPEHGKKISLDQLDSLAKTGQIKQATLMDEDSQVIGKLCNTPGNSTCPAKAVAFYASYPRSDVATQQLIQSLSDKGATVEVNKQTDKAIAKLIIAFVFPLAMLANLFGIIFMWKGSESSIGEIAGFGTLGGKKGKGQDRSGPDLSFEKVAGADEAVAEMREVTDYLTDPGKFEAFGASPPKGVMLFGPPGCGKTLLARATAGESNVPFFSVSGTEFVESLVGVGAARVRDLFRQVREVAPAIVFIDEIDAVGRRRSGEGSSGGEREQTLNQLLVEMDGFEVTAGIVLMGATNRPDILDPALLRPGRFDRHVTLVPPDVHGRQAILELHAAGRPIGSDVDFEFLARRTPGFTGADLANVINEAALLSIRQGDGAEIRSEHLTEAVQRVLHGPQRRGTIMTPDERRRLAFHETGHAVVAAALGQHDSIQRISIVARGRSLGQSITGSEAERVLLTTDEMESRISVAMGGIAAEMLIFGNSSTTSEDDIDKANSIAKEMAGLYGMTNEVGRLRLLSRQEGYLSLDGRAVETMSGETMMTFDRTVKAMIEKAERTAKAVLEHQREQLEKISERLEQEETLEGGALESMLAGVRAHAITANGVGRSARAPRASASRNTPNR